MNVYTNLFCYLFFHLLQLFLLKRGGQVTYAGPLGQNSHKLVEYFEVCHLPLLIMCLKLVCQSSTWANEKSFFKQAIPGVPKIKEGYNPATWMLDVSTVAVETQLGVDFAEIYANSELYQ